MAMWSFRKRRKKSKDPKKDVAQTTSQFERKYFLGRRNSNGRNTGRRSCDHDRDVSSSPLDVRFSDFPLPPSENLTGNPIIHKSHNQKPQKTSGIVRILSRRKKEEGPSSVYHAISNGENSKKWKQFINGRHSEQSGKIGLSDRRGSSESLSSARAFKLRTFDLFAPRPVLRYEDGSLPMRVGSANTDGPVLISRSNSRRTNSRATQDSRYKGVPISEERLVGRGDRVEDLVEELDTHGLRQAMERDQRRRKKKTKEQELKAQQKLEQQARQQQLEAENNNQLHRSNDQTRYVEPNRPHNFSSGQRNSMGNETPLSWFNDNPSSENVIKENQKFSTRAEVVTPVSMDSREYHLQLEVPGDNSALSHKNVNHSEDVNFAETRMKTNAWTSFIKRATAARIKKEQEFRNFRARDSTLMSDSEGEDLDKIDRSKLYVEAEDLRHREGRTPGRHVPYEVSLAMNAVATGHIQDKEYEEEMRDAVLPAQSATPHHYYIDKQANSRSSLDRQKRHQSHDESFIMPTNPGRSISQQSYHSRPHSAQRYSPSLNKYISGTASPDDKPRSVMSTSFASIDSEGSWLSGKINPRQSVQQNSPLKTSVSSLRKRYQDQDDEASSLDDIYFDRTVGGASKGFGVDEDTGDARLDLDDTEDDESVRGGHGRKMWRGGVEKKTIFQEPPTKITTLSREASLKDFYDEEYNASTGGQKTPDDGEFSNPSANIRSTHNAAAGRSENFGWV